MWKLTFILILTILLVSCSNKLDESLLIGKYRFNTDRSDIIDISKDHTYIHRYVNTEGKTFECHGKWRYNGKEILFHNFNFFNDEGSGIWISELYEKNGKIQLIYSDDDNTYFQKE